MNCTMKKFLLVCVLSSILTTQADISTQRGVRRQLKTGEHTGDSSLDEEVLPKKEMTGKSSKGKSKAKSGKLSAKKGKKSGSGKKSSGGGHAPDSTDGGTTMDDDNDGSMPPPGMSMRYY